ncbi:MAG: cupin domain-containing protein [Nitrososphaerales archaeon]
MREFIGPDGARIRELAGRGSGLVSHSLAIITHPAGMATVEHHHTVADEVYYVQSGSGRIRVDGEERRLDAGDTVIIRPGQRHKLWADAGVELVLVVTCAPAYSVTEVIWDE